MHRLKIVDWVKVKNQDDEEFYKLMEKLKYDLNYGTLSMFLCCYANSFKYKKF